MSEDARDKWVQEQFRDYMRAKVSDPQVRREKKQFIAEHFAATPWYVRKRVLVPSFAFAMMLAVMPFFLTQEIAMEKSSIPVHPRVEFVANQEVALDERPQVQVKRVASKVGPTMVYQKLYQDKPVTVIWVFAKGG